jgi:hypothetical protein
MSWIEDEAIKAREQDEEAARRENAYQQQRWQLWRDLTTVIAQDVEQINQNEDLVKRKLGGEKLRFQGDGDGSIEIVKITITAMYLRIWNRGRHIEIEREIVTNGQERRARKEHENISLEIDGNYRLILKNEAGNGLTLIDASKYILTPILRLQ